MVTVTAVPLGVVGVTVGDTLIVKFETCRMFMISAQRVRASVSLVPGLVTTFAAS